MNLAGGYAAAPMTPVTAGFIAPPALPRPQLLPVPVSTVVTGANRRQSPSIGVAPPPTATPSATPSPMAAAALGINAAPAAAVPLAGAPARRQASPVRPPLNQATTARGARASPARKSKKGKGPTRGAVVPGASSDDAESATARGTGPGTACGAGPAGLARRSTRDASGSSTAGGAGAVLVLTRTLDARLMHDGTPILSPSGNALAHAVSTGMRPLRLDLSNVMASLEKVSDAVTSLNAKLDVQAGILEQLAKAVHGLQSDKKKRAWLTSSSGLGWRRVPRRL